MTADQSTATMRRFSVSAETALAVVGARVEDVEAAAATALDGGPAYLVGSLATGLGNAASDVDVHVLRSDISEPIGPRLYFIGETPVDVVHYPAEWRTVLVRGAATTPVATFAFGKVALGPVWEARKRRSALRWPSAVPLRASAPPILTDDEVRVVLPLLLQVTLNRIIALASAARLADAAQAPETARRYLWERAGRHVLDLRCQAGGDLTTGEKWLPDRVRRLGFALTRTRDYDEFRATLDALGLPPCHEWKLTRVRPAAGARRQSLAGTQYLITPHDQVLDTWTSVEAPLIDAVAAEGPGRILTALRRAELDLVVDDDAVREALT